MNFIFNWLLIVFSSRLLSGFLFLLAFCLTVAATAQPFSRDTTFNLDVNFNIPGSGREILSVLEQPDGKLLINGYFTTNYHHCGIARFHPDGQPDLTFQAPPNMFGGVKWVDTTDYGYFISWDLGYKAQLNHNGQYHDTLFVHNFSNQTNGYVFSGRPIRLPDGNYLFSCGACFYQVPSPPELKSILRVFPDGIVDPSFKHHVPGGGLSGFRYYDSTRIMLSGIFEYYDSIPVTSPCRISLDGVLDVSFQSAIIDGSTRVLYVQPDGKLLVNGIFEIDSTFTTYNLVRLNADGSLDSTFNNWNNGQVGAVCPTSDGGYLFGGSFSHYQGQPRGGIAKVDANGFLEPSYFTGSGFDGMPLPSLGIPPFVTSISRTSNDRYYITGYFNGYNGEVVQPIIRLNGLQTVAAEQPTERVPLTLYPNPATDKVQLSWRTHDHANGMIIIRDLVGKPVHSEPFLGNGQILSTRNLASGIYLVSVTDASGMQGQQKLVVQR